VDPDDVTHALHRPGRQGVERVGCQDGQLTEGTARSVIMPTIDWSSVDCDSLNVTPCVNAPRGQRAWSSAVV
jgi:hypothetical protein